jgi:ArsR family transcriptional regulator
VLKLLSDDTRWRLFTALQYSDRQASELSEALALPQNLVSYHLGLLRRTGLIQSHRSDADARVTYYGIDITGLQQAYAAIGAALPLPKPIPKTLPDVSVIFLCTQNSARSQMAEGWLRHLSGGRVRVRSGGVRPTTLHPLAVEVMAEAGIDIGYQQAKTIESIDAPPPVVVVTVCDLAREACPPGAWEGPQLHWSISDPVQVTESPEAQRDAFRAARDQIRARVLGLLGHLPVMAAQPGA